MDLLPKERGDFRKKEYWDAFFKKRGKRAFEWYGEYHELCGILHKYIKPTDPTLVVGCGNSTLSCDLYDVGYKNLISIDVSERVIDQMTKQNKSQRPDLTFCVQDVTAMQGFAEDRQFSVVLDKGTLDAMFTDDSEDVTITIDKMFSEIERVLKFGGRYICISLLQSHIVQHAVSYFSGLGWPVRLVRCREAEDSKPPEDRQYPVFAFIATKFKKMSNMKPVLELSLSSDGNLTRLKDPDELIQSVKGIQEFAMVRAGSVSGKFKDADPSLDLMSSSSNASTPRYSLYLADRPDVKPGNLKFSAFIVPQGREVEWLFSTKEGRGQLCQSADCRRMVVVHLNREHNYESLDLIKKELSGHVLDLSPPCLPSNTTIPFLSLGEDDEVGSREGKCHGKSEYSGEYVVEDVSVNGELFRRLIFLSNAFLVQSEAKLKIKGKKRIIDHSYLAFSYHSVMVGSLSFRKDYKVLVIGLGGGGLVNHINKNFSNCNVDVVEIDPSIVRVAKDYFGFSPDSAKLCVHIEDGIGFIETAHQKGVKYDNVMFDVNSKDSTIGMSCPPKMFVTPEFLKKVKDLLKEEGLFVLNLTCRDPVLKEEVIADVKNIFKSVVGYQIPQGVNEILLCSSSSLAKNDVITGFKKVNHQLKDDLVDVNEALRQLKVY